MFALLSMAPDHTDIMYAILRWIVVVELLQNGWSFSVVSSTNQQREGGTTLMEQARRGQVGIPWHKSEREHIDEHRLEDVFLDAEVSAASGPDDDFHFREGKYHFDEGVELVNPLEVLEKDDTIEPAAGKVLAH
jgi:hypothetical protein